jgi:ABC-2 type transport system permease protein
VNATLVTFKRELFAYFVSPVSWIVAVLFYLWRGFDLYRLALYFSIYRVDVDMLPPQTYAFGSTYWMVVLVPGLLTMRTFAEERRTGSIETLLTAPVRDVDVILGKWLAATAFFAALWLPSVLILHALEYGPLLGVSFAFGPIFAAYLGMFLLSGMLLAFGCFASSLTDNVLLAALLAIMFDVVLLMVPRQFGGPGTSYYVRELIDKFDVMRNFNEWFARGLIDTSQIAFYLGGIGFFLGLTAISLSARRIP